MAGVQPAGYQVAVDQKFGAAVTRGGGYSDAALAGVFAAYVSSNAHGRTDFLIHGDNSDLNFSASEGCIILKRATREAISNSGDTTLYVTY